MYRLQQYGVIKLLDNISIPEAQGNKDWQEYQKWLSEGNTPEPEFSKEELAEQVIEAEAQKEIDIRDKYEKLMESIVKPYSEIERETWPKQEAAWRTYYNNGIKDGVIANYITILAGSEDVKTILEHIGKKVILYEDTIFDLLRQQREELNAL